MNARPLVLALIAAIRRYSAFLVWAMVMRCVVCHREWHVPTEGGVYYLDGKPVCSLSCADIAVERNSVTRSGSQPKMAASARTPRSPKHGVKRA
jgi:hypothetical protein